MQRQSVKVGTKFGHLTVIKEVEPRKDRRGYNIRMIECICKCGAVNIHNYYDLKTGRILTCGCIHKDKLHARKSKLYGVGINDYIGYINENAITQLSYQKWKGILERCYSKELQSKHPSYIGCYVCNEWLYFSNFKKWFDENYNPQTMQGYHLDKDILIKGNKMYSPDTCCLVPNEINTLLVKNNARRGIAPIGVSYHKRDNVFIANIHANKKNKELGRYKNAIDAFNAYKLAKEAHIKLIAKKYYAKQLITKRVYKALLSYKVDEKD